MVAINISKINGVSVIWLDQKCLLEKFYEKLMHFCLNHHISAMAGHKILFWNCEHFCNFF